MDADNLLVGNEAVKRQQMLAYLNSRTIIPEFNQNLKKD
jgi:hypothetical protein